MVSRHPAILRLFAELGDWRGETLGRMRMGASLNDPGRLFKSSLDGNVLDANNIFVNLQGLSYDDNTVVSLDVAPAAAVPEPTSLLLLEEAPHCTP